jgi:hypothetical protein
MTRQKILPRQYFFPMPPFLHREKSKKNKKVWVGMKASGQ